MSATHVLSIRALVENSDFYFVVTPNSLGITLRTLKLTIDNHEIQVESGATILDAAKELGIEIPTFCHLDGLEPATSCFVCAVQVRGRPRLSPACTAPAEEGMVVTTNSDDCRAARRTAVELLLSDHVGDCDAPCTVACPAGLDIPEFIRHIAAGQHGEAISVIKERIPLAATLGRICPRYCERVCRRRDLDDAIAICALKRFPADVELAAGESYVPPRGEPTGKKVAIVGAGPAGLSAAYYLLQAGHACTIFDAHNQPGGMLRYAVPEFRLPKASLECEIDVIRQLGAEFQMNTQLGADVGLDDLRGEHDVMFLAIGAQGFGELSCEGGRLAVSALEFLRETAEGRQPEVGGAVVVVGGGDEAVDSARTAVRLGAKQVTLLWSKTRREMTAFHEYVGAAEAEGITIELQTEPVKLERSRTTSQRIQGDNESLGGRALFPFGFVGPLSAVEGGVKLTCCRGGRTFSIEATCVIAAQERRVDKLLLEKLGLAASRRGIAADRRTLVTNLEGVFAGGEAASGPSAVVRSVAAGRRAAASINQYLSGEDVVGETQPINVSMGKLSDSERIALFRDIEERPRAQSLTIDIKQRRTSFAEVERGLNESDAKKEAARCLQCDCIAKTDCKLRRYATDYNAQTRRFKGERRRFERDASHPDIIYESGKCVLCGLCVRIADKAGEEIGMSFINRGFSTYAAPPFDFPIAEGLSSETAKRCAAACPTGALAMKRDAHHRG